MRDHNGKIVTCIYIQFYQRISLLPLTVQFSFHFGNFSCFVWPKKSFPIESLSVYCWHLSGCYFSNDWWFISYDLFSLFLGSRWIHCSYNTRWPAVLCVWECSWLFGLFSGASHFLKTVFLPGWFLFGLSLVLCLSIQNRDRKTSFFCAVVEKKKAALKYLFCDTKILWKMGQNWVLSFWKIVFGS